MIGFLGKRLAHVLILLLGVSLLGFGLIDMAPGEYFAEIRLNPQISAQTLAKLEDQYGMNRPLPVRYVAWVGSVVRGDLGFSFVYNSPVWPLIRTRVCNTLILTICSLVCSWLLAIPLGVWTAAHHRQWPDHALGFGTSFLLATPNVLIGLGLMAFALRVGWFPLGGMSSIAFRARGALTMTSDFIRHLILPVLALTAGTLPIVVRHVRSAMIDILDAPFFTAARGHGIGRQRLLFYHALPAAMNPLISLFGISIGTLLSGSLLIEVIMSWPGVGPILLQAILERDPNIVIAVVMLSTLFFAGGTLLSDVLLYAADPRIRRLNHGS